MQKIFGSWSAYDGIEESWQNYAYGQPNQKIDGFPTEAELLFASYGGGSYEGDAVVIFERDGKLYEAHGSHCSCYGLEGQWSPEETTVAALAMREKKKDDSYYYYLSEHDGEAIAAYWALVEQLAARTVNAS